MCERWGVIRPTAGVWELTLSLVVDVGGCGDHQPDGRHEHERNKDN